MRQAGQQEIWNPDCVCCAFSRVPPCERDLASTEETSRLCHLFGSCGSNTRSNLSFHLGTVILRVATSGMSIIVERCFISVVARPQISRLRLLQSSSSSSSSAWIEIQLHIQILPNSMNQSSVWKLIVQRDQGEEMSREPSTHGRNKMCINVLVSNPEGRKLFRIPSSRQRLISQLKQILIV